MRLCGRVLTALCITLAVALPCEAQQQAPLLERAVREAVAARVTHADLDSAQGTVPASTKRDSLLGGAMIGFAVGAAVGMAFTYAVRDSDLDASQYAYGALVFGGIGAGVGLGIDALFDRGQNPIIRSPRNDFDLVVPRRASGVSVSVRW